MKRIIRTILNDITAFGSMLFSVIAIAIVYAAGLYHLGYELLIGILAAVVIGTLCKLLFFTNRPKKQRYHNIIEKIDASSFPSIHATRITVLGLTTSIALNNWLANIVVVILIVFVGLSRIFLEKHRARDVIAGILLGVTIVLLVHVYA